MKIIGAIFCFFGRHAWLCDYCGRRGLRWCHDFGRYNHCERCGLWGYLLADCFVNDGEREMVDAKIKDEARARRKAKQ